MSKSAKNIMIQGSMSNVGKSLLAAGLCRVLMQDGYSVAPFKSQNMALNSFITTDGGEMGRSQVVQAEAAGILPDVRMNPILLKPTTDVGSQVIVCGQPVGTMHAAEYFKRKKDYLPVIRDAYGSLAAQYDIIVIEGAGSPAELNLKKDDIVNMGLAKLLDAPVLLVGDIDRGGVFAQLYGTVALLEPNERALVKGVVINKFRGERSILEPGIKILEQLCGVPVAGVIPYTDADIDAEDSLAGGFDRTPSLQSRDGVDIAVIRLPRISNFTDFSPFERLDGVSLRYVDSADALSGADMIIIPGTKSTVSDLQWMRLWGIASAVIEAARGGAVVFGVCGGYQMLGRTIIDPSGVESEGPAAVDGMGLIDMDTVFDKNKVQTQTSGVFEGVGGVLSRLNGLSYRGYEIHMGRSLGSEPPVVCRGNIYGSYIHGLFDSEGAAAAVAEALLIKKGGSFKIPGSPDALFYKQRQYDILADAVRGGLDMELIYRIIDRKI